jgi:hypothetical protein
MSLVITSPKVLRQFVKDDIFFSTAVLKSDRLHCVEKQRYQSHCKKQRFPDQR